MPASTATGKADSYYREYHDYSPSQPGATKQRSISHDHTSKQQQTLHYQLPGPHHASDPQMRSQGSLWQGSEFHDGTGDAVTGNYRQSPGQARHHRGIPGGDSAGTPQETRGANFRQDEVQSLRRTTQDQSTAQYGQSKGIPQDVSRETGANYRQGEIQSPRGTQQDGSVSGYGHSQSHSPRRTQQDSSAGFAQGTSMSVDDVPKPIYRYNEPPLNQPPLNLPPLNPGSTIQEQAWNQHGRGKLCLRLYSSDIVYSQGWTGLTQHRQATFQKVCTAKQTKVSLNYMSFFGNTHSGDPAIPSSYGNNKNNSSSSGTGRYTNIDLLPSEQNPHLMLPHLDDKRGELFLANLERERESDHPFNRFIFHY